MKSMKQSIAALIALALFSLIAFVPKQVVSAPIASNAENIVYDADTKTLTVSGEVTVSDIINSSLADGGWRQTVEHAVFLEGTKLTCDILIRSEEPSLFGAWLDTNACGALKTISMHNISLYVADTKGLYCAFQNLGSLEYLDFSPSSIELAEGVTYIGGGTGSQNILYYSPNLSECNFYGLNNASFLQNSGATFYEGFQFRTGGFTLMPWPQSFQASKSYFVNPDDTIFIDNAVPEGNYKAYVNGVDSGQTVSGYTQWKAFADAQGESDVLTFIRDGSSFQVKTYFDANESVFSDGSAIVSKENAFNTELTLPEAPAPRPDYTFLGWASSSSATTPEIRAGQTENLPKAGLCPNYYFAVWKSTAPVPVTVNLTFDANGGVFKDGTSSYNLANQTSGQTINPETPTKDDFSFIGWKNATTQEILEAPLVVPDSDTTYMAEWHQNDTPGTTDGWNQSDAGWQYALDGEYVTGWLWIDDDFGAHWYYFNEDTYMATNQWMWDEGNSSWYWLCSSGPMIRGLWQWIDNEWYGFWWDGKMCRGWVWDNAWQAWFYCYSNGIMARNAWEGPYWLNWEGVWIR